MDALPPRARAVGEYRKSRLRLNHIQGWPLDCPYCIRHTYGLWDQRVPRALVALACRYAADHSQRPAEQPAAFIRDRLLAFFGAAHLMGAS